MPNVNGPTRCPDSLPAPPDHAARLEQARRRARWEIGDPSWADTILYAYLNPASDHAALALEMEE